MKAPIFLLAVLSLATWGWAQLRHEDQPNMTPVAQHGMEVARGNSAKGDPTVYQPQSADLARLKQDAEELASLAQTIPPAVEQTGKGILPKDLDQKLKRIEKLSKELRSGISR